MKENCTTLYPNAEVARKVSEYADDHSHSLPPAVLEYHDEVQKNRSKESNFMISILEAKFLQWLTRMMGAQRGLFARGCRAPKLFSC